MSVDSRQALIRARLSHLNPVFLKIEDESHHHIGHEGAKGGGSHFAIRIISPAFEGLSLLQRHRLIFQSLKDLIPHEIHALKIVEASSEQAR